MIGGVYQYSLKSRIVALSQCTAPTTNTWCMIILLFLTWNISNVSIHIRRVVIIVLKKHTFPKISLKNSRMDTYSSADCVIDMNGGSQLIVIIWFENCMHSNHHLINVDIDCSCTGWINHLITNLVLNFEKEEKHSQKPQQV